MFFLMFLHSVHSSQGPVEQGNAFLDLTGHHLQSWKFQKILGWIGREQRPLLLASQNLGHVRNRHGCTPDGLTIAINLLTRSSDNNTAYIVIFGSTSITNLQRLSKTVEYSCRWSSGTLVNLMAAIPGALAKDVTDKLAGYGEERQ